MNKKVENKESAERLKQFRKAIGLSQEKFSNGLGISKSAYVRYESGKREVPSRMMRIMFEKFNLSIGWLLFGEGGMFSPEDTETRHIPRSISERDKVKQKAHIAQVELREIHEEISTVKVKLEEIGRLIRELERTINEKEKEP
ncbi:MAG: helix-turn-helix domain-containing protein [Candidatus Aminicenantes bacterium]|nr:helix-turn-helix domain-containing protein [Candidatus Aminicenantes bacterium]NIM81504.1 helix-turn-helix domain-containing protein [Candidatus Aminicenantes bacterium]NIN20874.1 helix-turn-helix domain-containing protein [Candidatus Aminicenantes bacterium]NIN44695.1 helix-turn-helix domain-containing protein [Candidatus Aminicenantes bacterium]NIN87503.1 helix-turn-helix domain-containing protein [Candidatus Aminicenantes bacterium]